MARKLEYSPFAVEDLRQMRRWMSQPGAGPRAKMRARRIAAAISELRSDPTIWPKGDEPGTRQFVVEKHVVVYSVVPDTNDRHAAGDVYVLRIYGPGQSRET
jgi:plasmid stabilization system protein ParE